MCIHSQWMPCNLLYQDIYHILASNENHDIQNPVDRPLGAMQAISVLSSCLYYQLHTSQTYHHQAQQRLSIKNFRLRFDSTMR